ncbi:MAG: hypothetical protein ACSLEN_05480 [Candidatus Malihini olakiniferum]
MEDKASKRSLAPDNGLAFRIAEAARDAGAVVCLGSIETGVVTAANHR